MPISFYCTRCRRLLHATENQINTILDCPYCRQPVIVPTILPDVAITAPPRSEVFELLEEPSVSSPGMVNSEKQTGKTLQTVSEKSPSDAAITSKKKTQKPAANQGNIQNKISEKKSFQNKNSRNKIRRRVINTKNDSPKKKTRPDFPIPRSSVSAGPPPVLPAGLKNPLFRPLSKLPPPALLLRNAISEPPPLYENISFPEKNKFRKPSFRRNFILSGIIVVGIFGLFTLFAYSRQNKPSAAPPGEKLVNFSGQLTYVDSEGQVCPDEKSLVFAFPTSAQNESPLLLSKMKLDSASDADQEFLQQLRERGGDFTRVDPEGMFDLRLAEGNYMILLVSFHISNTRDDSNRQKLTEAQKYLYRPENLIGRKRIQTTVSFITPQTEFYEYNFGN